MSKKHYPDVQSPQPWKPWGKYGPRPCAECGANATHTREIRVSWFRGDDDVLWFCAQHRLLPADRVLAIAKAKWKEEARKGEGE